MTNDLQFVLKYYRGRTTRDWLEKVAWSGRAHGSELIHALGGISEHYATGMSDNVASADRILKALLEAGWIVREVISSPSREQRFFGVGGGKSVGRYPCEFGYTPPAKMSEMRAFINGDVVYG